METLDDNLKLNAKGLSFNGTVQNYLNMMSGWSVVITVFVFMMMLSQISVGAYLFWLSSQMPDSPYTAEIETRLIFMGWLYFVVGGVLIFPALYLIRFSINVKRAFKTTDQGDLEFAVRNLRNLFIFAGSYMILFLLLILIGVVMVATA